MARPLLSATQRSFCTRFNPQLHPTLQPFSLLRHVRKFAQDHSNNNRSIATQRESISILSLLRSQRHVRSQNGFSHVQLRSYSSERNDRPKPVEKRKPLAKPLAAISNRLQSLTPHENIYTLPNILTFSRLIAAPFIGYLFVHEQYAWSLGLFAYAGLTDLVDGYIARKWKMQTVVGTVIDPMADKVLMTILTVCLAVKGALPLWLATLILGRDVGLGLAAIYYRFISLPEPKTFARYWDFSIPSAEVHPTGISKVNTALQLALIGATTALPIVSASIDIMPAMTALQYTVAATTIWSGASYLYTKDAVKILTPEETEERIARAKASKDTKQASDRK